MRKALMLVTAATMVAACGDPTVPSGTRLVNRIYVMTSCRLSQFDEHAVPCEYYSNASAAYFADSSRLVIRDDGTASWVFAGHTCSSADRSCSATTTIDSLSGTYHFDTDSLLVHFTGEIAGGQGHDAAFTAAVPETVSEEWSGPDVLNLRLLAYGAYFGVFKPE